MNNKTWKWNWCWAEWSKFKPPYAIFFHTSCNKHDELYSKWKTLLDKINADIGLLYYMCKDVAKLPFWKQPYYYLWCLIYFIGLSLWGYKAFNNAKEKW